MTAISRRIPHIKLVGALTMGSGAGKLGSTHPDSRGGCGAPVLSQRRHTPVIPEHELGPEEVIDPDFIRKQRHREVKAKIRAVAAFTKQLRSLQNEPQSRQELKEFVAARKSHKEESWVKVKDGDLEGQEEDRFRIRPKTAKMAVVVANATRVSQPALSFMVCML